MDEIDRSILEQLYRDGRMSNADLAARVGLSASACLRRVQALEKSGAILGYRARLDPARSGRGYVVYVSIGLSEHSREAQEDFECAMAACDEVTECYVVAGAFEYLLRVEVRDLAAFKEFHASKLGAVAHVRTITSHMVMGVSKDLRS